MKTNLKRRIATIITTAAMAVGVCGITASANTITYGFNLGRGGSDISDAAQKENYLSYADVSISSGNISSETYMYFCIYGSDASSAITASVKKTEYDDFRMFYNTTTPSYGTNAYLKGNAGYYGSTAGGEWTP